MNETPLQILNAVADRYKAEQAELERLRRVEQLLLANPDRLWPEIKALLKAE
ncbi:MAG: hypothetical protein KME07_06445 [Pegethrix bostrychoides GSE-TBD4-15B]|jgi:hypothetical protein|uniref:Uncharacterized protein n=1 Tax=Pegethrix bostrychoides GSE-TBD4-15B TaxID=2839662 RepID=A0A951P935_9CYAN|nr:hypothetical protein [Pegethrix bostrychoides GSE-TBD4-15B]